MKTLRTLWAVVLALRLGLAVQAQQQVNNFTVKTNLSVGGNVQTVTLNGYNVDAIVTNSAASVATVFAENLQSLLSETSPSVAKLAYVLNDDSSGDATRGTYRYDPTLTGPETATVFMAQDKLGNTASTGRWVRMSAGDNYQMSVDTLDDALAVSPAYLAAGINPTNSIKLTVKTRARKALGSGGAATYRYTTSYSGTTNLGVAVAYGAGHLVADTEDGVSVRLFGARGDDSTDDTTALNAAILWGAQNKTPIKIPEGQFRFSSALLLHHNTTILGTPNGVLRPNFTGAADTFENSFMRNTNLFSGIGATPRTSVAGLATNIVLRGLRFEAVAGSSTNVRGLTLIAVRDVVLDDIDIDRTYSAWAFTFYAQDLRASKLRVRNNQALYEDGIHVLGGERIVISDSQIQSGDDCLAVGWDSSDVFARDILFNNITVKSYRAFPLKIFAPPEMTAGVTVQEKIIFSNITGEGGINRNGGVFLYEQGTPRGAITNVLLSNIKLQANSGTHDGVNPYGVWLIGTSDVTLDNVTVQGSDSHQLIVNGLKGPLLVNNSLFGQPANTNTEAVFVYDCYTNTVTFNGVTAINDYYRPLRAIESDLIVNGGTIRSGGAMHLGFQTATNATRTLRMTDVTFQGTCTVPVQATGSSSNLLTYIFTGNVTPSGSTITGITATNYRQLGNVGMSAYDSFQFLEVNQASVTNFSGSGSFQITNTAPLMDFTAANGSSGLRINVRGSDANNLVRFQTNGTTTHTFKPNGDVRLNAIELGHDSDTTVSRQSAGVVALESVPVIDGAVGTLAYSGTTVNITAGKGVSQEDTLTCTNSFSLTFSSLNNKDAGYVTIWPAATNCTITLPSYGFGPSGSTLTVNGGTGNTNYTVLTWFNTVVGGTNRVSVNALNYYR